MPRLRRSGNLTFLRAHELGTGFGPDDDFIDVELVSRIDAEPNHAFGLQLRNGDERPSHEGMAALLRDSFNQAWETTVEYDLDEGRQNGILIRVELRK
jgi:hypothetical protein